MILEPPPPTHSLTHHPPLHQPPHMPVDHIWERSRPLCPRARLDRGPELDKLIDPGPGSYQAPSVFGDASRRGVRMRRSAEILRGRRPDDATPGPNYSGDGAFLPPSHNALGTLAKGARFRYQRAATPSPGDYTLRPAAVNNVSNASFRSLLKDTWTAPPVPRPLLRPTVSAGVRRRQEEVEVKMEGVDGVVDEEGQQQGKRRRRRRTKRMRVVVCGGRLDPEEPCFFGSPFVPVRSLTPGPGWYAPEPKGWGAHAVTFAPAVRVLKREGAKPAGSVSPSSYSPDFRLVQGRTRTAVVSLTS